MNKLEEVKKYSLEKLGSEKSGHDFYHSQRVAKVAKQLAVIEGADEEMAQVCGFLHDVIDDKVVSDVAAARKDLLEFLKSLGYSATFITAFFQIIDNISFSKELEAGKENLSLTGKVVQDADRIDALGAIGIMRTAYYGGSHQDPLYDPKLKPRELTSKKQYRQDSTVINHFYEKLFKLPDLMNTVAGKKEALARKAFMEAFLEKFYEEWQA